MRLLLACLDCEMRWQKKYRNDNGVAGVTSQQIVVSPGGKYSCMLAIQAVVSPGDEVIIPAPYWVSYPEMVKLAGGIPKIIFAGMEADFKISPEQLKSAISDKTRLVILNSPSNYGCRVQSRGDGCLG